MRVLPISVMVASIALLGPSRAAAFDPFSRLLGSVEKGNHLYGDQHFEKALESYDEAEQQVSNQPQVHFNRGNALFKLGRIKEAREAYLRAMGSKEPGFKKKNYYNIGNTFLAEGAFRDAISYYRRALEIDAAFDDARFNLEIALRALEQQKRNDDSKSGQKKDDQGEKQEKKDEGDKDQQKQGEKEKDDSQKEGDQQEQDQEEEKEQQGQQKDEQKDEQQQQQQQDGSKDDQREEEKQGQQQQQQQQQQQDQQQRQGADRREGKEQKDQPEPDRQPADGSPSREKPEPGRLSPAQVEALLDAMRENEKPFQMHKFVLPKYKGKEIDKDW